MIESDGPFDSEVWCDYDVLKAALKRDGPTRIVARLRSDVRDDPAQEHDAFDEMVPTQRSPGTEDLVDQEPAGGGLVDDTACARVECRLELGGDELAVEVVLVIDGRHGEVDLRRPVRRMPPVRTA